MNTNCSLSQKYNPSDEIVNLVYESVKIPFNEMNVDSSVLNQSIKKTIPISLVNLFATIGRDFVEDNKDSYSLTNNGKFTEYVIDAIVFRIPVEKQYKAQFSQYLYDEIVPCTLTGALDTELTKLSLIGNELVLIKNK